MSQISHVEVLLVPNDVLEQYVRMNVPAKATPLPTLRKLHQDAVPVRIFDALKFATETYVRRTVENK